MFGQFARQDQSNGRLDFSGRHGRLLVVSGQLGGFIMFFLLSYFFFEKKQNVHAHISYTNESIDAKLGLDDHACIH